MVFTDPPYGVSIGDKNKFLNSIQKSGRILENIEGDTLDTGSLHRKESQEGKLMQTIKTILLFISWLAMMTGITIGMALLFPMGHLIP